MAVIAEVMLRGITREQYDAIRERTGWLEHIPGGGLAHLTWWEGADCHNTDAWESEAAFSAFGEQRLGPAMAALGIDAPPEVTFHPAHEVYLPRREVIAATPAPNVAAADNVGLVRGGYDSFAAGDIPAVLALFHDELVWSTLPSIPFGGVYHGPGGAGDFLAKLPEVYAELNVMPERLVDAGDTVVAQGTHRGRTVNGTPFEAPFVHVWTWRAGKATSFTEVMDSATVVGALGAVPAPRTAATDSAARTGSSA